MMLGLHRNIRNDDLKKTIALLAISLTTGVLSVNNFATQCVFRP